MVCRLVLALSCVLLLFARLSVASCDIPELPTDLDLITSVEATKHREVHLHGMYRIGSDKYNPRAKGQVHNMTLLYTEAHEFRLSALPHDALSLELSLYSLPDQKMIRCSMKGSRGSERMIFATLQPNVRYVVSFVYSMAWSWGASACPSVMVELAVMPQANAPAFSDACLSTGAPTIPAIVPKADASYYFEFVTPSDVPHWIGFHRATGGGGEQASQDESVLVGSYPIVVPHIPGRHQRWKFTAQLQARFLDSGDVSLMLTPQSVKTVPSFHDCANGTVLCFSGSRAIRNHYILQTLLWSDLDNAADAGYTLWVVRRPTPSDFHRKCAPVSFHIALFPLAEEETFVTCNSDPLPQSFNTPGLYDNLTGVMTFSQSILVNLTTRVQEVRLQPTVQGASLMRVYLGAHDELDIDLVLLKRPLTSNEFVTAAVSMAIVGPEGVLYPVDASHEYILRVSVPYPFRQYTGKDHDFYRFCDTYHLTVHVFPTPANDASATLQCDKRPPIFHELQEFLNATQRFEFGLPSLQVYSFTHPIDVNSRMAQESVADIRFYIPTNNLMLSAIIYSDAYSGTVQMQLVDEDAVDTNPLYSKRRTVGSSLLADLEEGWYTLKLLTPYVQTTSQTYKDVLGDAAATFPTCLRYNMLLRLQSRNSCLDALQLPEEYPTTAHLHRHVADTYEIPLDGKHFMTIAPQHDAIVHLLTSASDYALRVLLFEGDTAAIDDFEQLTHNKNLIATGASVFGTASDSKSEVLAQLSEGKTYTLVFDFTASTEWDQQAFYCSTFDMQMSLSKVIALTDSEANDCDVYPDLPEDADLGELSLPFALGPKNVALHPKGHHAGSTTALFRSWSMTLTVSELATARVNLEYEFTHHAFGMLLCKCSSADGEGAADDQSTAASGADCNQCTEAFGYFNGLELPSMELDPGQYVLYIKPWEYGVFTTNPANDINVNFCAYGMLQLFLAPAVSAKQPPPLCSSMLQYLPSRLNNVAFLSPYYNDEMHLFQNVLISSQHLEDKVAFRLGERSILRATSPSAGVMMSMQVSGAASKTVYSREASLYVALDAGEYELRIHFFLSKEALASKGTCPSIPMEISIMTVEDISAVSVAKSLCDASLPFPSRLFFHGHDTLYRVPNQAFAHTLDLNIGELGGEVEFDIRYNFETSGLQVKFYGEEPSTDGSTNQKTFTWAFYADRAYLSATLRQGTYHLQVSDPASSATNNMYAGGVPTATCVPYSLHLRSSDYGNYSHFTPVPSGGGSPAPAGHDTPEPELDCRMIRIDSFPSSLFKHAGDSTFSFASSALEIPFSRGTSITIDVGQHHVPLMIAKHVTVFTGSVTQSLRVWVRTEAQVFSTIRIYDATAADVDDDDEDKSSDADNAIATSHSFGYHTQSMYYPLHRLSKRDDNTRDVSSRSIRLEVIFYYRAAPRYNTDYTDCNTKQKLTTFAMYAALFSEDDLIAGTQCNDTVANLNAAERLPPSAITLGKTKTLMSRSVFLTQDEATLNAPRHHHITPAPRAPSDAERRMVAAALGDIPGVTVELRDTINMNVNTTVVIPQGTLGARVVAHVRYPLNAMNLRLALFGDNQTEAIMEGIGLPTAARDGLYQAEAVLSLPADKSLTPGTYHVVLLESNVLPFHWRQLYCIPVQWTVELTAAQYPDTTSPPSTPPPKPRVLDVYPRHQTNLDRSDPLELTFVLSEEASMVLHRESAFVVLQRDDNGAQLWPSSQYFADTDKFVVVFGVGTLEWGTAYHVVFNTNAVHTARTGTPYDVSTWESDSSLTYSTATCGCTGGFCVAGGGCQCAEPNGERCNTCAKGYRISARSVVVGTGSLAATHRICELAPTSAPTQRLTSSPPTRRVPLPPRTTPAPTKSTAAPITSPDVPPSSPAEDPAKSAGEAPQPPLRTLRYVLAYCALALMVFYTIQFSLRFRSRAKRSLLGNNPFRRQEGGSSRAAMNRTERVNEDDEDLDDDDNNLPTTQR